MQLTERLEKLIWQKKAKYETWTIGTPASGLEVKDNETVIIIGFDYFDYVDPEENVESDYGNFIRRLNKQITFMSKNRRWNFLHRAQVSVDEDPQTLGGFVVTPSGGSKHYECYMPFTDNISCDIATFPAPDGWAGFIFASAPEESEQPRVPLGYGNDATIGAAIATLQRVIITGVAEIRAFKSFPGGLGLPGTQTYHQWNAPFNFSTAPFPPIQEDWGVYTYPCLTVHLVRINERLEGEFI